MYFQVDLFTYDYWFGKMNTFPWVDLGIACAIFILFLVFRKIFTTYVFKLIIWVSRKTPTEFFTNVFLAFEKPIRAFFVIIGTYLALLYLPFTLAATEIVEQIYQSLFFFLIGWGFYNFASENSSIFVGIAKKFELDKDSMLVPFLSKVLKFVVIALTFAVILDVWEYNIGGFIAGLGLGGLAFALAAQDTVANFFGGVVIITEKPFSKGDWISTPSVEGTVQDITFRSTKIRTFADSIVTVPNSKLANEPITNWTQMRKRRVTFNLGIVYSTPRVKVKKIAERIDTLLRKHEEVDQDMIMVRFNEFNQSSLDIFIYFFTKTTQWVKYLEVKEDINLKIMDILEEEGVSVAFPSRSLYFEKDSNKIKDPESSNQ